MLKTRRFWIGVVFSTALLSLFFVQVDLSETVDALKSANYVWFIPAIAIYFVAVLFRSLRWHFFLRGGGVADVSRFLRRFDEEFRPPSGDMRVAIDRDPVALL